MYDLHELNIMYDYSSKDLKVIDCDAWSIVENYYPINKIRIDNFIRLRRIFSELIGRGGLDDIDLSTDFVDYYETIRKEKEDQDKIKILTIGDMKNSY